MSSTLLRRRNHNNHDNHDTHRDNQDVNDKVIDNDNKKKQFKHEDEGKMITTYWMTTILILRCIAFIYLIAFCVAFYQNKALIGINGIYPYTVILERYELYYKSYWDKFVNLPTLLWWMPRNDESIEQIALIGIILSSLVIIFTRHLSHVIIFTMLWLLYHSLVNVGQLFYSYGWESQLLETGFLAIFLCRFRIFPSIASIPPSKIILYLFLWLTFRIMIGAGMIKIRAGGCWLDYTCMDYHYETQPNPNPISWLMHNNPHWFHQFEVLVNHFAELIAPWFLLLPFRNITLFAALIQIFFQFLIIVSGNLSFLNWLTIIPSLAGLDDIFCYNYLWFLFFKSEREYLFKQCRSYYLKHKNKDKYKQSISLYRIFCIGILLFIGYLSQNVINNLLSKKQIMNTSFDKFRIVNTYGAFGTVGKERFEVIFEMTNDKKIDDNTKWEEILFKCKPGPINRRPCMITPYHYRLDWQIWFAGFKPHTPNRHSWIFVFIAQLLIKDENTINLLDQSVNTYLNKYNITYIKADMYQYHFTNNWNNDNWWKRKYYDQYLPPLNLKNKQFQNILNQLSWNGIK